MADTRENLIELIDECSIPVRGAEGHLMAHYSVRGDEAEYLADHLIANGVTVGDKWVSTAERLPEDDLPKASKRKMIRCLVYTDKGTVKPCVRQRCISRKVDGEWVYTPWEWNKDIFAKPTHWMPLPQPPKGE